MPTPRDVVRHHPLPARLVVDSLLVVRIKPRGVRRTGGFAERHGLERASQHLHPQQRQVPGGFGIPLGVERARQLVHERRARVEAGAFVRKDDRRLSFERSHGLDATCLGRQREDDEGNCDMPHLRHSRSVAP